jgi:hypothetical protein
MNVRLRFVVLAAVLSSLLGISSAFAQQNEAQCKAVLTARMAAALKSAKPGTTAAPAPASDFCNNLAALILDTLSDPEAMKILVPESVARALSPRDFQSRSGGKTELGGSAGQSEAVPGVQPTAIASGSIAAVNTDAGRETIAALSVNPIVLFLAEKATQQLAKYSRLADLTVFVPVSSPTDGDGPTPPASESKLRYVGVRLRLNFAGHKAGKDLWQEADRLLEQRIVRLGKQIEPLFQILTSTSDVEGCTAALLDTKTSEAVTEKCGSPFAFTANPTESEALRAAFAKIRRKADSQYWGLDLRMDTGDPTLGAVANSSGQYTFAGLSFGRQFGSESASGVSNGLRVRAGYRNVKLDSASSSASTWDFAAGYEMRRPIAGEDEMDLAIGVEIRGDSDSTTLDDALPKRLLRGSISIPIVGGASVSLNLTKPLVNNSVATIAATFNWGLLLSNKPTR